MSELLPHITLDTGLNPQYSIIWLHGLGANGEDFVPIVDEIHLPHEVRYIFPNAPKRRVTINGGFIMPAWYDISTTNIGEQPDAVGIRASQLQVEKLIAHEMQRGIPASHIFLAGFSQGGAIALFTGLRFKQRLGGILALSTYLPLSDTLQEEAQLDALSTHIFMAHGLYDTVIPLASGKASAEFLLKQGCILEWYEYAMQHTVCMEEIQAIEQWLTQRM